MSVKKILVVEDVAEIRRLVRLCTLKRYQVYEARDAQEALAVLAVETPDLVVTDLGLPGSMDGLEFLARLEQMPNLKPMRRLILTGRDVTKAALPVVVDALVKKPFRPDELADLMGQLLPAGAPASF